MVNTVDTDRRLTQVAHELVVECLKEGDTVIDATAGNGHDTVFLRTRVGSAGLVYAMDIQSSALQHTRARIDSVCDGEWANIEFVHACHSKLKESLPLGVGGTVACVMFNLGYLPGGDHTVMTGPRSTAAAVSAALDVLKPGGILTLLVYTGHPGGVDELKAVEALADGADSTRFTWTRYVSRRTAKCAPQLFVARKETAD